MPIKSKNSEKDTEQKTETISLNDFILPLFQDKKPMNEIINTVAREVEHSLDESITYGNFTVKIIEAQSKLGFLLNDSAIKDKLNALKKASKIPENNYNKLLTFVNDFCGEFYIVNKNNEPETSKVQKFLKVMGINPEKGKSQTKINKTTLCIEILMDNLHNESEFKADVLLRQKKPSGDSLVDVSTPQKIKAYEYIKDVIYYGSLIESKLPTGMKLSDIFNSENKD